MNKSLLKKNIIFSIFIFNIILLNVCKQIFMIINRSFTGSLFTGWGNIIYIVFAFAFFLLASKRRIMILFMSYTISFTTIFIFTGRNTLLDIGGVCRTIRIYNNPNTMAMYASIALFMSIFFFVNIKKIYRYIFLITFIISLVSIINSSSRAVYLGIIIPFIIACFLFTYYLIKRKIKIRTYITRKNIYLGLITMIFLVIGVLIYYPSSKYAVIRVENEKEIKNSSNKNLSMNIEEKNNSKKKEGTDN